MKYPSPLQLMLIPALVSSLVACQSSAPRDDDSAAPTSEQQPLNNEHGEVAEVDDGRSPQPSLGEDFPASDEASPLLDERALADLESLDQQATDAADDDSLTQDADAESDLDSTPDDGEQANEAEAVTRAEAPTSNHEETVHETVDSEQHPPLGDDTAEAEEAAHGEGQEGDPQGADQEPIEEDKDGVLLAMDTATTAVESETEEAQPTYTLYRPVESQTTVPEDPNRLWLPPVDSSLATIEIPLSDIANVVDAARNQAREVLASNDHEQLQAAHDELGRVQAAIYGLAVRMRSQWTQMEYQSFLSSIRFHEILDLSENISNRQSHLRHQAWAYARPSSAATE